MNKLNKIFLGIIVILIIALCVITGMYLNQRNLLYKYLGNYDSNFNENPIEKDSNSEQISNLNKKAENLKNTDKDNSISIQDNSIDNVTIEIKEKTLSKVGATIIITDKNEKPYSYGEWYRIDKKEDGKWKMVTPIIKDVAFTLIAHTVRNDGTLEQKIDWSKIYGELESGEYRLVKDIYENGYKYFGVEFTIDY